MSEISEAFRKFLLDILPFIASLLSIVASVWIAKVSRYLKEKYRLDVIEKTESIVQGFAKDAIDYANEQAHKALLRGEAMPSEEKLNVAILHAKERGVDIVKRDIETVLGNKRENSLAQTRGDALD